MNTVPLLWSVQGNLKELKGNEHGATALVCSREFKGTVKPPTLFKGI